MVRARRDDLTLDLLSYRPKQPVERYDEPQVRAATLAARVSKAVSAALKADGRSRAEIASAMADYLGEAVSEHILNRYAAESASEHAISASRLIALAVVTGDLRLLNAICEPAGAVAVDQRYEALIRRERAKEMREQLDRDIAQADAEWKSGRGDL